MGICGTGKSGIDPKDEASEAADEVVKGLEGFEVGENISSL